MMSRSTYQSAGLILGPVAALAAVLMLPETYVGTAGDTVALSFAGKATLGLMIWMAFWWLSEAIDISATALLPLVVLPLVTVFELGSASAAISSAASPYADPLLGLFLGGFLLAISMQRWGLDRRIALITLRMVGTTPVKMIGGFMLATAVLSMFVSNTATAAMMLPIAISVIAVVEARVGSEKAKSFSLCLMLGIAYAASVGGIGTIIGTPPNVFLVSFVSHSIAEEYRQDISFVKWMGIGLPIVAIMLPMIWILLTRVLYPVRISQIEGGRAMVQGELEKLGSPSRGEWIVLTVFVLTALGWTFRPLIIQLSIPGVEEPPLQGLTDSGLAIMAGLALFAIPISLKNRVFALDWDSAQQLPWGILILFGGGLSLAAAVKTFGVAEYLGSIFVGFDSLPDVVLVLIVCTVIVFLTEMTSNTATTATLLPILAAVGPSLGVHPYLLILPAALAASCAFMMPVATPPNAIVFGSGRITIPQMCKAGLWLNIFAIAAITSLTCFVIGPLLGLSSFS